MVDKAPFGVLIGLAWTPKHQPTINWSTDEFTFESDFCKKNCHLKFDINLEEVPLFKQQSVVGMIECPNEINSEVRIFVVVTEEGERPKESHQRVLTIRTRNVSSCEFDEPFSKSEGSDKAKCAYHVMVIKPGESPTLDALDYHDSEQAFKELTEEEKRTFPEWYKDFIDQIS